MARCFPLVVCLFLCFAGSFGLSATASPPARAQAAPASVDGLWTYSDARGGLHVLGEVVNASPWALGRVVVIVRVQNRDGTVLAERKVRPLIQTLDIGGESPFAARFGGVADPTALLAVAVSATPVASRANPLRVTDQHVLAADGRVVSSGRVRNVSHKAMLAEVAAAFHDAAGHVVGVQFGYVSFAAGQPGRTRTFRLEFQGRKVGNVDVAVAPMLTSRMRLRAGLVQAIRSSNSAK